MPAPLAGQVVDGFRYLGGDPNQAGSWGPANMVDSPEDRKALIDARDQSAKSLNTAVQAGRFMALNAKTSTGPIRGAQNLMGMASPDLQSMNSITSAVAPGMRPPGSGSSSDKDVSFYRQGFPNIESYGTTNQQTDKRLHDLAVQDAAKSAYLDSWFQHKGTLLGAEPAFQSYWAKKGGQQGQAPAPPSDLAKLSDAEILAKLGH